MDFLDFEDIESLASGISRRFRRFQFGSKAQLAFLEDFFFLVNDGIPANRAIEMMAEVTTGLTREVALSISQKISEGRLLADGMREWFAVNIIEIIRVGEEGGALAETLKSAIKTLSQKSSSIGALIGAISYPLLVISIACTIIVYLNNSVFIQFRAIKPLAEWPDAGQQLVGLAEMIQTWWWLFLLLVVLVVVAIRYLLFNYTGELRPLLDRFPPFSLYRRMSAARFMETLGLLVANGVVFKNAIKVMQYQANPYLASHLVTMEHLLGTGKGNVADVLSTGLINEADILRLRVMAEVKGFEHGLIRMGIRGSEQSMSTLKAISKLLGGLLLAVGGMLIILIVRGIYATGMSMGS
jgi:type II secretory pathway component PulF